MTTPEYWLQADDRILATAIAELEAQAKEMKKRGRK